MNELPNTENITSETIPENQKNRVQALIDILYLTNVTWLYVFSIIYPLFGIILGVIILTSSISDKGKRIGKICLILGIVNIVISILGLIVLVVLSRYFNNLIGWSL